MSKKTRSRVYRDKNTGKELTAKRVAGRTVQESVEISIKRNRAALDKLKKQ